jgi:hypothetical protein
MARFTAEGLAYGDACKMIDALRQADIDANITAGGVAVYPEPEQVNQARNICKGCGASFDPGFSSHQESVMLQSSSGWDVAERVTNDAAAIAKEWEQ